MCVKRYADRGPIKSRNHVQLVKRGRERERGVKTSETSKRSKSS